VALAELRAALRWLGGESPQAARRLRERVIAGARLLGANPAAGPVRPELAAAPVRVLTLRGFPYLLIYEERMDGPPVILRMVHTSRDVPPLLRLAP